LNVGSLRQKVAVWCDAVNQSGRPRVPTRPLGVCVRLSLGKLPDQCWMLLDVESHSSTAPKSCAAALVWFDSVSVTSQPFEGSPSTS
jgi:hypothetical protein